MRAPRAVLAAAVALAVTVGAMTGCGAGRAEPLTDLAFSTNAKLEMPIGVTDYYYSFHVGAPAHEPITVERLRWVPGETSEVPNSGTTPNYEAWDGDC